MPKKQSKKSYSKSSSDSESEDSSSQSKSASPEKKNTKNEKILSENSESQSPPKKDKKQQKKQTQEKRKDQKKRQERSRSRSRDKKLKEKRRYQEKDERKKYKEKDKDRRRDRERNRERDDKQKQKEDKNKLDIDTRQGDNTKNEDIQKPEETKQEEQVEKPSFDPSGILARFSNSFNGVVLKFTEPLDAKIPTDNWRIYPFKNDEPLPVIHLTGRSCFLFGKDPRAADIPTEHPTCSGQHAVIQFREKKYVNEEGHLIFEVKPYIMDLDSTNGTKLNGEKIESARYYELKHTDILKFGSSTRDFVVMKESSSSQTNFTSSY